MDHVMNHTFHSMRFIFHDTSHSAFHESSCHMFQSSVTVAAAAAVAAQLFNMCLSVRV